MTILNLDAPNNTTSKYTEQNYKTVKREKQIAAEDFNIPVFIIKKLVKRRSGQHAADSV